ncbi:hypothetical protein KB1_17900 [Cutibacterium modestum]|uniref:Uncharacterized protein n=1 Tax=Cutibacterium modestum TaxID=2559073 RepID=A0AAD1KRI7_9ACTN|nr:hypothetical protein KB1_17900 [Cutibacterium modestum]
MWDHPWEQKAAAEDPHSAWEQAWACHQHTEESVFVPDVSDTSSDTAPPHPDTQK